MPNPDTMDAYASILLKPWRDQKGIMQPPGEVCEAAAAALREMAELHRLATDWRVSAELIGIRIKNGVHQQIRSEP